MRSIEGRVESLAAGCLRRRCFEGGLEIKARSCSGGEGRGCMLRLCWRGRQRDAQGAGQGREVRRSSVAGRHVRDERRHVIRVREALPARPAGQSEDSGPADGVSGSRLGPSGAGVMHTLLEAAERC